jgi:hypothetical protein
LVFLRYIFVFLFATLFFAFYFNGTLVFAEKIENKQEQFVYGLRVFDRKGYIGTFCPKSEDSIYIIANSDNIINPRMTEVYYWPITQRYKADFDSLNIPVFGSVEIFRNGKLYATILYDSYALVYNEGYYAGISKIVTGEEAILLFKEFEKSLQAFRKKESEYIELLSKYNDEIKNFYQRTGKNSGSFDIDQIPKKPNPPQPLEAFVQEPSDGIHLNLPEGRYQMRLLATDGSIVENSEKNLISFSERRTGNIGYEIIPEDRWTLQETSSDPDEIIYYEGDNILYLRPFKQVEYNDLFYAKLLDPQNTGNPERWRWINIKQLENSLIRISTGKNDKSNSIIEEKPYKIKQTTGPQLGYEVIELDPESGEEKPSIVGHKIKLEAEQQLYFLSLVDKSGKIVPESYREFRQIRTNNSRLIFIVAFLLPLIVGAPIWFWRKYKH